MPYSLSREIRHFEDDSLLSLDGLEQGEVEEFGFTIVKREFHLLIEVEIAVNRTDSDPELILDPGIFRQDLVHLY
jgi:hypothetical protein